MKTINYTGSSKIIKRIVHLLNRKAPLPLNGDGDAEWGTNGQVLTTDGQGNTSWTTPQGGGGDVTDVEVNGTSVVNAQGVAEVSVPTATSDLNNDSGFIDGTDLATALGDYTPTANLANVATSGDYDDLTNKPTIPAAQVQSDWSQADNTQPDYIKNKPTKVSDFQNDSGFLTSVAMNDISDVSFSNLSNGQIMKYNSTTQKWENANESGGSIYTEGDGIDISAQDVISVDTTFTEASTRANIESGDTFSTILGKIKKFFTDLKTVAFSGSASDLTYDNASSGLSATDTQEAIDEVVSNVETIIQESVFTVEESGGVWYLYWHGATGECPWSVTQSGTDYELNFTYTTA